MNVLRRLVRKIVTPPMVVVAALILFVEEWLWDRITKLMAIVARAPAIQALEDRIAQLSAYAALAVFLLPGILLFPVKLLALYLLTHSQKLLGLSIIIAAKLLGTALVVRIFTLNKDKLLTVGWFRFLYETLIRLKTYLYGLIKNHPAWHRMVALKAQLKYRFNAWLAESDGSPISRRWKAIIYRLQRRRAKAQPENAP